MYMYSTCYSGQMHNMHAFGCMHVTFLPHMCLPLDVQYVYGVKGVDLCFSCMNDTDSACSRICSPQFSPE